MSSLGLREDRQAVQALLSWIVESLPDAPWGGHREQARSYRSDANPCRSELARDKSGPDELSVLTQTGGWVASIEGR
ncbi:hypothetical protein [Pseudomonas chlororaphis]|uniref:hypothetical protein n=1 Tax=Pseudomonas chlororaphis TaxID=587753 RepID=UPI000F564729|nr:hypothetical protein [Pseudomonas chlororaphis]